MHFETSGLPHLAPTSVQIYSPLSGDLVIQRLQHGKLQVNVPGAKPVYEHYHGGLQD